MPGVASSLVPLLAVLMLSSLPATAQRSVAGRVVDSAGHPIAGATVRFGGVDSVQMTSSDGAFALCSLPDSVQEMLVAAPGYAEGRALVARNAAGFFTVTLSRVPGARRGMTLWGKVTDQDGKPLLGVAIHIAGTRIGGFSKPPDGHFMLTGFLHECEAFMVTAIGFESLDTMVEVDGAANQGLLFSLQERFDSLGSDWVIADPHIIHGEAGTIREITNEEIDRSVRPTLFGTASP